MWKVFQRLASTRSGTQEDATVYCLQFVDKPMYLVCQPEVSSTDSVPQSTAQQSEDTIQSLPSEQN
jgi:sensor domain CHASE-containing protein